MEAFINTPAMQKITAGAEALQSKKFSDVTDAAGHQYVDLVQEGGGVLGIALAGYTYTMEKAGIRFFSLAGTSAGAINTLMMAGLAPIGEPVSERILDMLSKKDLFDLVDGNRKTKKLIQKAIDKDGSLVWPLIFNGLRIFKTLRTKLGVNPGNDFLNWITTELSQVGIQNLADLNNHRSKLPEGLQSTCERGIDGLNPRLALITSDITTHSKIELPKMASLYWADSDKVEPADMVRASMSIPFFFEPFTVDNLPNKGESHVDEWKKHCSYNGKVPEKARFVDGGMLSNFPINVFHLNPGQIPRLPTFGARLSAYRRSFSKTDTLGQMSGAMVQTMRQIYDYDFILRNPDFRSLICQIDADQEFNWLNFGMKQEQQVKLFELGAEKALKFLEKFNWEAYKNLRRGQAEKLEEEASLV